MARHDAKDTMAVVPWYWRDWRASTARSILATNPTAGWCYRELLDAAWGQDDCHLPDEPAMLAALAGVPPATWSEVAPLVLSYFKLNQKSGRWYNARALHEWKKARGFRKSCRERGLRGAEKRWPGHSPAIADGVANDGSPSPSPSPSPSEDQIRKEKKQIAPSAPVASGDLHPLAKVWNETAGAEGLPKVVSMNPARRRRADARLREAPLETWTAAYRLIASDPFCRGSDGWRASFDYATRPEKCGRWLDAALAGERPSASARSAKIDPDFQALVARHTQENPK